MHRIDDLLDHSAGPLILDGPMGTMLSAAGFDVDRPGWSARALVEAPELVAKIHQQFLEAGAHLLTANTFRTHAVNLAKWGRASDAAALTQQAVEIAKNAAGDRAVVLGSLAPLGDCYEPARLGNERWLRAEHQRMAETLADCGVGAVLLETHVSGIELKIAAQAVHDCKLPLIVSVYSHNGVELLDGTSISRLAVELEPFEPLACGVNCVPAERVARCLDAWRQSTSVPLIAYANAGELQKNGSWKQTVGADSEAHTELAGQWIDAGLQILGGCCGTSPALIAQFSRHFGAAADDFSSLPE